MKAELPVTVEPMNAQNAAAADLDAAIAALKVPAAENLPLVAKGTKNGSAMDQHYVREVKTRPLVPMTRRGAGSSIVRPTATVIQAGYADRHRSSGGEKVIEVTVKEDPHRA